MKRDFVKILEDQREVLNKYLERDYIDRAQVARIEVDNPCAQIITGIRRCGKSSLCHLALKGSKVRFGYVDFDDEKLEGISSDDLNDILQAAYVVYGQFDHLFLDEVQDAPSWPLFVNRLLKGGMHLVITGSNSHMLSSELATHLTGRHIPIELTPFTFEEFRRYRRRSDPKTTRDFALARSDYEDYLTFGGFPEVYQQADVRFYFKALYDMIVRRDIVQRKNVRTPRLLSNVTKVAMENFATEVSCAKLARQLEVSSVHVVQNYLGYLEECFLVALVPLYGRKAWERTRIGKIYAVDVALATFFNGSNPGDDHRGRRLENLVYQQLRNLRERLDYSIYYLKEDRHEVDFLLEGGGRIKRLIQVSYDISNPKTRERELAALFAVGAKLNCTDLLLITDHENGEEKRGDLTVRIVDIVNWLLEAPKEQGPVPLGLKGRNGK